MLEIKDWIYIFIHVNLFCIFTYAVVKLLRKSQSNMNCLLYTKWIDVPPIRLRSRKPSWICLQDYHEESVKDKIMESPVETSTTINFSSHCIWKYMYKWKWSTIVDHTKNIKGLMLPRKDWVTLNRFWSDMGKCRSNLATWK